MVAVGFKPRRNPQPRIPVAERRLTVDLDLLPTPPSRRSAIPPTETWDCFYGSSANRVGFYRLALRFPPVGSMEQIWARAEPQRGSGTQSLRDRDESPRDGTGIPASDILNYPPDNHGMVTVGEEME
jgi:hypothetical protein